MSDYFQRVSFMFKVLAYMLGVFSYLSNFPLSHSYSSDLEDEKKQSQTHKYYSNDIENFLRRCFTDRGIEISEEAITKLSSSSLLKITKPSEITRHICGLKIEGIDLAIMNDYKFIKAFMVSNELEGTDSEDPGTAYQMLEDIKPNLNPIFKMVANYCICRMVACDRLFKISGDQAYDLLNDTDSQLPKFFHQRAVFYKAHLRANNQTTRLDDIMAHAMLLGIEKKLQKIPSYGVWIDNDLLILEKRLDYLKNDKSKKILTITPPAVSTKSKNPSKYYEFTAPALKKIKIEKTNNNIKEPGVSNKKSVHFNTPPRSKNKTTKPFNKSISPSAIPEPDNEDQPLKPSKKLN